MLTAAVSMLDRPVASTGPGACLRFRALLLATAVALVFVPATRLRADRQHCGNGA